MANLTFQIDKYDLNLHIIITMEDFYDDESNWGVNDP